MKRLKTLSVFSVGCLLLISSSAEIDASSETDGSTVQSSYILKSSVIAEAVASADSGDRIFIVGETYGETMTISKPLTLMAPAGKATIGQ